MFNFSMFVFRLLFGTTQYFVFVDPNERDSSRETYSDVTFEMAQEEIGKKSGIAEIDAGKINFM